MMRDVDPTKLVEAGYDRMASRHLEWTTEIECDPRLDYLHLLLDRLQRRSIVLDLGCGAGVPCTARLAEQHRVIGVDLSAEQLRLAAEHVPDAMLVRGDISRLRLHPSCLDGVTAFYSLGHVPRARHRDVLAEVFQGLRPGGWLLATMSADGTEDTVQDDFLGVPMFFSGFDAATNRQLLTDSGFSVATADAITMREPEGDVTFLWVLAQRPNTGPRLAAMSG